MAVVVANERCASRGPYSSGLPVIYDSKPAVRLLDRSACSLERSTSKVGIDQTDRNAAVNPTRVARMTGRKLKSAASEDVRRSAGL